MAAVAAVRARAAALGIDAGRIVLMGVSAGAHLAMVAGMAPELLGGPPQRRVAAIVNFYGIADVGAMLGSGASDIARQWLAAAPDPAALAWHLSPLRLAAIAGTDGDFPEGARIHAFGAMEVFLRERGLWPCQP